MVINLSVGVFAVSAGIGSFLQSFAYNVMHGPCRAYLIDSGGRAEGWGQQTIWTKTLLNSAHNYEPHGPYKRSSTVYFPAFILQLNLRSTDMCFSPHREAVQHHLRRAQHRPLGRRRLPLHHPPDHKTSRYKRVLHDTKAQRSQRLLHKCAEGIDCPGTECCFGMLIYTLPPTRHRHEAER
jgi:hypothetical protein